ncbi:MAG: T9SS type A sorting domain-containing protein [Paludibacteraceae bacterium]|nr:T9SS type A sorting domain-containing protein [Paludibacteraceae bacterium]
MKKTLLALVLLLTACFASAQTSATLPLTIDFEDAAQNALWDFRSSTASVSAPNDFVIGSAVAKAGSNSLYISNDNGVTNAYTNNEDACRMALFPFTVPTDNSVDINFSYMCEGESNYDFGRVFIIPQDNQYLNSFYTSIIPTSGVPNGYGWIAADGGSKLNQHNTWTDVSTSASLSAGNYYLACVWRNDYSDGNNPPIAFDNITISERTCYLENVQVSGITAGGAANLTFVTDCPQVICHVEETATGVTPVADATLPRASVRYIRGLQANTEYTISLRGICANGDTTVAATCTFRTLCADITVDAANHYTENWESYTTGSGNTDFGCWTRGKNASNTNNAYVTANGGSNTMYMYAYGTNYLYVATPAITGTPANQLRVNFRANFNSTNYGVAVGFMSDPTDATTFVAVDTVRCTVSGWGNFTVDCNNYTGTGTCLAFFTVGNGVYLDDIEVLPMPSCVEPNVTLATAAGSITVNIAPVGSPTQYEVVVTTDATNSDASAVVYNQTTTSTTVTVGNLQDLTNYYVFVRAICSATDQSAWVSRSIQTPCGLYAMPFTEDFSDANFPPACWSRSNTLFADALNGTAINSYNGGWSRNTSGYGITDPHTKVNIYGSSCKYWLITPAITINAAAELSFDLAYTAYGNGNAAGTTGTDDKFIVAVSTDGGNTWTAANVLREWNNSGSAYVLNDISNVAQRVSFDLSAYVGQNINIAFYGESTVSNADNDLRIGNIRVAPANACADPDFTYTVGVGAVDINIVPADATQSQFEVVVTTDPDNADASAVAYSQVVTGTTVNVTGLNHLTTYYVFVRAICSATDQSYWVKKSFTTPCGNYSVPYAENFAGFATSFPSCWGRLYGTITAGPNTSSSGWSYTSGNGIAGPHMRYNLYSTNSYWLVTPSIAIDTTAELSFDLAKTVWNGGGEYTTASSDDRFLVVVSTDDGATWSEANAIAEWNSTSTTRDINAISNVAQRQTVSLNNYVGQSIRIGFYAESTASGTDYDLHIGNINIDAVAAPAGPDTITLTDQTCAGTAYTNYGFNITEATAGTYVHSRVSADGDSVFILTLTVNPVVTTGRAYYLCSNQLPMTWHGQDINAAGDYVWTGTAANGCDSVVTLHVFVTQAAATSETIALCPSQLPYSWNGQTITAAGEYTYTTTAANNCDSVVTLTVTLNQAATGSENVTICASALPYTWNGQTLTAAGTYTHTTTAANGCDSVVTLTLTVNEAMEGYDIQTVCENDLPYVWNGQSYNAPGTYTFNTTAANGCDSIATLYLMVAVSDTTYETMSICQGSSYAWNGQTLTTAGEYTAVTGTSTYGCPIVSVLTLTVTPGFTTNDTITVCDSDLPYTWNGQTLTAAGTYTFNGSSQAGCDSVVTLTFVVNNSFVGTETLDLLDTELPYTWNGIDIEAAGEYTYNGTTAEGCDSVITLTVNVTVGLEYAENGMFNITPNPVERGGVVRIDATIAEASVVELFSANGKLISRSEHNAEPIFVNMPQEAGLYMVRLTTATGKMMYGKVIVK